MSMRFYATLARQQGLKSGKLQLLSNNLANSSTTATRQNKAIFAEIPR